MLKSSNTNDINMECIDKWVPIHHAISHWLGSNIIHAQLETDKNDSFGDKTRLRSESEINLILTKWQISNENQIERLFIRVLGPLNNQKCHDIIKLFIVLHKKKHFTNEERRWIRNRSNKKNILRWNAQSDESTENGKC